MAIIKYVTGQNLARAFSKAKALISTKAEADLSNVSSEHLNAALESVGFSSTSLASIGTLNIDEDGIVKLDNQLAEVGDGGASLDGYVSEDFVEDFVSEYVKNSVPVEAATAELI